MKPLCISTFIFGNYTKFIPFYIYSVLKSYPEYYVKLFVNGTLSEKEKECVTLIRSRLSQNFEIKENYFEEVKKIKIANNKLSRKFKKYFRWLIPYEEFYEFENVYIGDVDFLIVKEKNSILDGHLEHCNKIKLPYSNVIRPDSKRLTGLHFIKVKEYYQKMNKIIASYLNELDKLDKLTTEFEKYGIGNEEFLYSIIESGIGFGDLKKNEIYRPHHGFHIRCISRNGSMKAGYFEPKSKSGSINARTLKPVTDYNILKNELTKYFNDPLFIDLLEILPLFRIVELSKRVLDKSVPDRIKKIQQYKDFVVV